MLFPSPVVCFGSCGENACFPTPDFHLGFFGMNLGRRINHRVTSYRIRTDATVRVRHCTGILGIDAEGKVLIVTGMRRGPIDSAYDAGATRNRPRHVFETIEWVDVSPSNPKSGSSIDIASTTIAAIAPSKGSVISPIMGTAVPADAGKRYCRRRQSHFCRPDLQKAAPAAPAWSPCLGIRSQSTFSFFSAVPNRPPPPPLVV